MEKLETQGKSIRFKVVSVVLIATAIMAFAAVLISFLAYSTSFDEHYKALSDNLAKTAAAQMNGDKIEGYYNAVKVVDSTNGGAVDKIKDKEYYRMLQLLYDIKNANNIEYIYVQRLEEDTVTYIMDADNENRRCDLGTSDSISSQIINVKDRENGISAFISNDTFGWLCTSMEPVYNSSGVPVALVGVDISMNKVMADRTAYLVVVFLFVAISMVVIGFLLVYVINKIVVKPIIVLNEGVRLVAGGKLNHFVDLRTGDEIETLSRSFNKMTKELLEYMVDLRDVTVEKERIGTELNVAKRIQAAMLPSIFPAFPHREEFDIYATMQPAKEVGGDFYDFFLIDDEHLAIVVADVSGKSVPAALFMVIAKTLIKNHTQAGMRPADVFTTTNAQLCEGNEAELFVTAWMGVLEIKTGRFTFVNAGHNPPLLMKKGGDYQYLKSHHGFVLAGMEDMFFTQGEMVLEKGDQIYLYTDGVTEATDNQYQLYGEERLRALLNANKNVALRDLLHIIKEDIDKFEKGAPQFDDITMLGLRIN